MVRKKVRYTVCKVIIHKEEEDASQHMKRKKRYINRDVLMDEIGKRISREDVIAASMTS